MSDSDYDYDNAVDAVDDGEWKEYMEGGYYPGELKEMNQVQLVEELFDICESHVCHRLKQFKQLVPLIKDMNALSNRNMTFLQALCENIIRDRKYPKYAAHELEIVDLLLDHGASINYLAPRNVTALQIACLFGTTALIEHLLKNGADPHIKDEKGRTPLSYACQYQDTPSILALLAFGANPAAPDNDGWTPLCHAVASDKRANFQPEIYACLLMSGATIDLKDKNGNTLREELTDMTRGPLHELVDSMPFSEDQLSEYRFRLEQLKNDIDARNRPNTSSSSSPSSPNRKRSVTQISQ